MQFSSLNWNFQSPLIILANVTLIPQLKSSPRRLLYLPASLVISSVVQVCKNINNHSTKKTKVMKKSNKWDLFIPKQFIWGKAWSYDIKVISIFNFKTPLLKETWKNLKRSHNVQLMLVFHSLNFHFNCLSTQNIWKMWQKQLIKSKRLPLN